ncbi:MAG: hypothetical protein K0S51_1321 [Bacillales bacterium]|jgi:hypothetical protein|nr:hypothetical protein [Bacillales bacterium]
MKLALIILVAVMFIAPMFTAGYEQKPGTKVK